MLELDISSVGIERPWLDKVVNFLNEIGIDTQAANLPGDCFLPGVEISCGTLKFDASQLLAVSDLLHEAGHLAVAPKPQRAKMGGQLSPEQQLLHGGEVEAIAWSFAAAQHLGMPLDELFHPKGYRGNAAGLAMNFSLGVYPGVHGLICAGLAMPGQMGSKDCYPNLIRWLRN